jgi:hypothetical protein
MSMEEARWELEIEEILDDTCALLNSGLKFTVQRKETGELVAAFYRLVDAQLFIKARKETWG